MVERKVGLGLILSLDFTLNYFLDGITLITKDEASGSTVTAEEAKKVLLDNSLCLQMCHWSGYHFLDAHFYLKKLNFKGN